jgi:hypothetical protein
MALVFKFVKAWLETFELIYVGSSVFFLSSLFKDTVNIETI